MLIAGLGVVAALAFVLGLGALALWALKRFGTGMLTPRSRVPVEVVQRVSLGPKTGLAVVRVGEKVMAMSIGEGGLRPLFELDEADRQRVLATSTVPTPHVSSAQAMSALEASVTAMATPVAATPAPSTYAPAAPARNGARDFHAMLGMSLRDTTRLAVFVGLMAIGAFAPRMSSAQGAPPVPPKPSADSMAAAISAQVSEGATALANSLAAQAAAVPTGRGVRTARAATPAGARPRAGNGAVTPNGTSARRAMSDMRLDSIASMVQANGRATPASPAAVGSAAGGVDALAGMMPQMDVKLGDKDGGLRLNGTVGIVVMMGLLTLLPTLVLMMTGFTRILIVLHFLKQAMGTQGAPPAHLLAGLALLLTGFVMAPTLTEVNRDAITPWLDGKMTQVEMMKTGAKPMREFMLRQTRESDIRTFIELSRMPRPATADDVPLHVLMSAFVASELRTAFQIGFAIYLPFIIIDTVVASVLMSMGMFMLPPAMISLPFKLLLFVLVDGWGLTIQSLVQSFK